MPIHLVLASVAWFFLLAPVAAVACPFCNEALFSPNEAQAASRLSQGYNLSIMLLMVVPFVVVGIVTLVIVRSAKRARRS